MTAPATANHRWVTVSSHVTSEGWVRYQRCACGSTRVLLGGEPVRPPLVRRVAE